MADIRANSVEVARIFQAQCKLCDWKGRPFGSYQEANTDRQIHLNYHRMQPA